MDYGIWTLLPIVVVVAVALKSKRALEPLILGTLLTYIIVDGFSFPIGWMDAFFRVATDQSHQWVFMVCGLFGALIALLGGSAGAWAGMYLFHHKTKHWYFVVGMPLILAAQLAAGVWLAGNSGLV